eukprot:33666-Rhodomonas_salina.2
MRSRAKPSSRRRVSNAHPDVACDGRLLWRARTGVPHSARALRCAAAQSLRGQLQPVRPPRDRRPRHGRRSLPLDRRAVRCRPPGTPLPPPRPCFLCQRLPRAYLGAYLAPTSRLPSSTSCARSLIGHEALTQ